MRDYDKNDVEKIKKKMWQGGKPDQNKRKKE